MDGFDLSHWEGQGWIWRVRFGFVSARRMGTRRWDDSEGPSLFSSSGGCRQMEQFFGVLPWEICLHAPLFPQEKGLLSWEGHPAQGSQPGGAGKVAWSSAQPAVWGAQLGLREQKAVLRWCSRLSDGWVCFQGQAPRFRRLIMKYSLNVAGKTVAWLSGVGRFPEMPKYVLSLPRGLLWVQRSAAVWQVVKDVPVSTVQTHAKGSRLTN